MSKIPPTYSPLKVMDIYSLLANYKGKDYTYKSRPAIDLGLNIRNETLDSIRMGIPSGLSFLNNWNFLRKTPAPVEYLSPPGVSPLSVRAPSPLTFSKTPDNELFIHIYLYGDNALPQGRPYLTIRFTPDEIDYSTQSGLKSLGVVGADLQKYHYGGSEDSLSFEIDWFDFKTGSQGSALEQAEKMLALTKGAGWTRNTPPIVFLKWGSGNNTPFSNYKFLVDKASYKPTQFTRYQNRKTDPYTESLGVATRDLVDNAFHPLYVKQNVTLKRVV